MSILNMSTSLPIFTEEVDIKMWFKKKKNKKNPDKLNEVLLDWSDEDLIDYIIDSFSYVKTRSSRTELKRIRRLNMDIIVLAIARMKQIEEASDNSKIVPGVLASSTFFATQIIAYLKFDVRDNSPELLLSLSFGVLLSMIIFLLITFGLRKGKDHRSNASRYRSLLEEVKSENNK